MVASSHPSRLTSIDIKGCTNPGSGARRIEASVVGINSKGQQDWRVLCESTPMTWDHITYGTPTHCTERVSVVSSLRPMMPPNADCVHPG